MTALPDLSGVPHPPTRPLRLFRPCGRFVVPRRCRVDLVSSAALRAPHTPWPRTRCQVETTSLDLRALPLATP